MGVFGCEIQQPGMKTSTFGGVQEVLRFFLLTLPADNVP